MVEIRWLLILALLGSSMVGCDSGSTADAGPLDGGPNDGGSLDGSPDGGPVDGGSVDGGRLDGSLDGGPLDGSVDGGSTSDEGVGFGASRGALTPADYSCRGTRESPTGGADVAFDLIVNDFMSGNAVQGLAVQFFRGNAVSLDGSCPSASCLQQTSAADGTVTVTAPVGGWYGYRVRAGSGVHGGTSSDYLEVVQVNEPAPAGGSATVNAVSRATRNTITALLSLEAQPSRGLVTGQLTDCGGNPVANAHLLVFDEDGQIPFGTLRTDHRDFYFNGGSFPIASNRSTHVDGLFGAANVPVPDSDVVRVELWGALTDGGALEMLGCEEAPVSADGVTIVNVGPTRADGPTTCSGS